MIEGFKKSMALVPWQPAERVRADCGSAATTRTPGERAPDHHTRRLGTPRPPTRLPALLLVVVRRRTLQARGAQSPRQRIEKGSSRKAALARREVALVQGLQSGEASTWRPSPKHSTYGCTEQYATAAGALSAVSRQMESSKFRGAADRNKLLSKFRSVSGDRQSPLSPRFLLLSSPSRSGTILGIPYAKDCRRT